MPDSLQVELVSADRMVWSGEARLVLSRTVDGELGVMANHTPLLSVLTAGVVEIATPDEGRVVAAINGGFISVAGNRVSILAEHADLADDIDGDQARRDLAEARQAGPDDETAAQRARLADARVKAVETAT